MKLKLVKCLICNHWRLHRSGSHCPICNAARLYMGNGNFKHINILTGVEMVSGLHRHDNIHDYDLEIARVLADD